MLSERQRTDLRPMDFGEILDSTIRILKTGWKPLLTTGLIGAIPAVIYNGLTLSLFPTTFDVENPTANLFFQAIIGAEAGNYDHLFELGGLFLFLLLFMLLVSSWVNGALIVLASRIYLGAPVTVGMALKLAGRRYFAILGTALLKLLFYIIAVPALVIGGLLFLAVLTVPVGLVVLSVYWAFTYQALLVENTGGGWASMSRSFRLISGRFWPLLGLGIVFTLFTTTLNGQLSAITQLPAQLVMTFAKDPDTVAMLGWVVAVFTGLLSTFSAPLNTVGLTLAYYDTRIRKEGLDLEIMAANQLTGADPR